MNSNGISAIHNLKTLKLLGFVFVVGVVSSVAACSAATSQLNNDRGAAGELTITDFTKETEAIRVRLTGSDSLRLVKSITTSSVSDSKSDTLYASSKDDLVIECSSKGVSKDCSLMIKLKPNASENSLQLDESSQEHMFQLRNVSDAKALYSSLAVKEWDLQGSTYKRFSTSDNKMILECILDEDRSRCSIFLSDGKSDDLSD